MVVVIPDELRFVAFEAELSQARVSLLRSLGQ
jgi:hypothetical protein